MQVVAVYKHNPAAKKRPLPLMLSSVRAGFPSPADDFIEKRLDLTEHLVKNPDATFYVRAKGDSMTEAGIRDGALLVVDRSIEAADGRVVVAVVEGNLAVKRFRKKGRRVWLESAAREPNRYAPIEVTDPDAIVWGVVTASVNLI
jgi:DNA polymerase V